MQDDQILSPLGAFFRKKWVIATLLLNLLVIVALIVLAIINAQKTSIITFNIAPIDADIYIGHEKYTNDSYKIAPGTYEVKISAPTLDPKTLKVEILPHHHFTLSAYLSKDGNFEFYELKENFRSFQKLREIASKDNNRTFDHDPSAEDFITNFDQILSIEKSLPIKGYVYGDPDANAPTAGFTIRYGQSGCKMTACLLVNYFGNDYENAVLEKIKAAGYDPSDYQILYERYN